MKKFGKKLVVLFLAAFLIFTNNAGSMMFAATYETETSQETDGAKQTTKKENLKTKANVQKESKTSEWVPFGDAWLDVSEDANTIQFVKYQNNSKVNNNVLKALDEMNSEDKRILFKKQKKDMTVTFEGGTIYGSKEHPIKEEYKSLFTVSWGQFFFMFGSQKDYILDSYTFLNKIPDSLKLPVPFYLASGEKNPLGWNYVNREIPKGYSNTIVNIKPKKIFESNKDQLKSGITYNSLNFSIAPKIYYYNYDDGEFVTGDGYYSQNGWGAVFNANMSVNYTVDVAPLTEGGSPTLLGRTSTFSPKAKVKGVNSEHFRNGELNNDESTYQIGLAQDGKSVSDAIIAKYGDSYTVQLNPDTDNGYMVDYYIITTFDPITGEKLKEEKVAPTSDTLEMKLNGKAEIRVAYKKRPIIQEPTIHKSSLSEVNVKKDDTITYVLDLENNNSDPFAVTLTDQLPTKQLKALSYEVKDGHGNVVKEGDGWPQSMSLMIPGAIEGKNDIISGKLKILIKARVIQGYSCDDGKNNIISNQAFISYDDKKQYSEVVTHHIEPKISYHMEKVRITEAPRYEAMESKYGFHTGNQVSYEIRIDNDGEAPLTMKVSDTFKDKERFSDVRIDEISKDGVSIDEQLSDAEAKITIQPQKTAIVTFSAKVAQEAGACLSDTAKGGSKGYANIGMIKELETSYQKITQVVYVVKDGIETNEVKEYQSENIKVTKNTAGFEEVLKEQTDMAYTPIQPSIWAGNMTVQHKGGMVEASDKEGNLIQGSKSNIETGDHDSGRLPSNCISIIPDTYWAVAYDKLALDVPYLNDEEKASVKQINTVTNGKGTLKYSYKNRYGDQVEITAKVTSDTGEVLITISDTFITHADGTKETIKGMGSSVDVYTEFTPTIWIENKTEDHAGGKVQVKDKTEWNKENSGNHEIGREVGTTVKVKPDTGWEVDYEEIQIHIPGIEGGTSKVEIDKAGNGTIIFTSVDGKQEVRTKVTTNADRSVDITLEDVQASIDVSVSFTEKKAVISIRKQADRAEVKPNESILYTITVTNEGDYDLMDVKVDDKELLPKELNGTFTAIQHADGTKEVIKNGSDVYLIGNLAKGESVHLIFKVTILKDLKEETEVQNTAGVESNYIPVGGTEKKELERKTANADVVKVNIPKKAPVESVKEVQIKKVWDDDNDKAGKRPDEIIVTLYENEEAIEELVLKAENGWIITYQGKEEYKYSVKEREVVGYTGSYENKDGEIIIINKYNGKNVVEPEKPLEPEKPNTGINGTDKKPAKPIGKPVEEIKEKDDTKSETVKTGDDMALRDYMFLWLTTGLICVGIAMKRKTKSVK